MKILSLPDDLAALTQRLNLYYRRLAIWATERAKIELSAKDETMIRLSEVEFRHQ